MLAVIKTGGKQYIVSPNKRIKIEKIAGKEGDNVEFSEVLLVAYSPKGSAEQKLEIGKPLIKNAKVIGKILKQGKGKKIIIFKYKPKKREQTKKGHRQAFTEIEIKEILFSAQ
ncbi:MAG: 50S ribosomal protein L21 [Patescibacteria group bacterium]